MIRSKDAIPQRLRIITISFAAWSGIAALFTLQRLYSVAAMGSEPRWDRLVLETTIPWGSWIVLTPLIVFIVRQLPLPSEHSWRVLLHVPIGIAVGLIHSLLVATITPLFIWRPSFLPIKDMFRGRLASAIAFETLIYFAVVAVLYALVYASQARERQIAMTSLLDEVANRSGGTDTIAVPERDGVVRVPIGSIDWVQAEDNYVRLHAAGGSHLLRTTLSALEKRLAARDFVRIHRSVMVSASRIASLRRLASDRYNVVLTNGAQLRVSRAYRKRVVATVRTPLTPE